MEPYKNLSGNSGVVAYETGPDFIKVQFSDGGVYVYTASRTVVLMNELRPRPLLAKFFICAMWWEPVLEAVYT